MLSPVQPPPQRLEQQQRQSPTPRWPRPAPGTVCLPARCRDPEQRTTRRRTWHSGSTRKLHVSLTAPPQTRGELLLNVASAQARPASSRGPSARHVARHEVASSRGSWATLPQSESLRKRSLVTPYREFKRPNEHRGTPSFMQSPASCLASQRSRPHSKGSAGQTPQCVQQPPLQEPPLEAGCACPACRGSTLHWPSLRARGESLAMEPSWG